MGAVHQHIPDDEVESLLFRGLDAIPVPLLLAESNRLDPVNLDQLRQHRFINKSFFSQLGYSLADIPDSETWFRMAYPDETYREEIRRNWHKMLKLGLQAGSPHVEMPTLVQCKSGMRRWFIVSTEVTSHALAQWHVLAYRDVHDIKTALEGNPHPSPRDPLTKMANRRLGLTQLKREWNRHHRTRQPFSLLMCDLDAFKAVNENHGHAAGDHALSQVANAFKATIRDIDCIARWGGEKFLVILPATDLGGAIILAERLRKIVEDLDCRWNNQRIPLTVSIGCAAIKVGETMEALLNDADAAMYGAKMGGRNRIYAELANSPGYSVFWESPGLAEPDGPHIVH